MALAPDDVRLESTFAGLGVDDLERFSISLAVSSTLGVLIPDDAVWRFVTIDDLVEYVVQGVTA